MDTIDVSLETCVRRHHHLCRALRAGTIDDPERELFRKLIDDDPILLESTPYLFDVSWYAKQCDLLFANGRGEWRAVELKSKPPLRGTGRQRKHDKTKLKRLEAKLVEQTAFAFNVCRQRFGGDVRALGLWYEKGVWIIVTTFG
jgi:hypothetical protein